MSLYLGKIIFIAVIFLFFLINLAFLHYLLAQKRKIFLLKKQILDLFKQRADLVPLLIVTFFDYRKIEATSLKKLLGIREKCYLEHNLKQKILLETKLAHYLDQICLEGEKNAKIKKDIDFLELKVFFKEKNELLEIFLKSHNELCDKFQSIHKKIYYFFVHFFVSKKECTKLPEM